MLFLSIFKTVFFSLFPFCFALCRLRLVCYFRWCIRYFSISHERSGTFQGNCKKREKGKRIFPAVVDWFSFGCTQPRPTIPLFISKSLKWMLFWYWLNLKFKNLQITWRNSKFGVHVQPLYKSYWDIRHFALLKLLSYFFFYFLSFFSFFPPRTFSSSFRIFNLYFFCFWHPHFNKMRSNSQNRVHIIHWKSIEALLCDFWSVVAPSPIEH